MAIDPGTTLILITCLICTIVLAFAGKEKDDEAETKTRQQTTKTQTMKTGNTHPSGFATPDENGTAVNAAEGAGGEQARIHSAEALHRLGRF